MPPELHRNWERTASASIATDWITLHDGSGTPADRWEGFGLSEPGLASGVVAVYYPPSNREFRCSFLVSL